MSTEEVEPTYRMTKTSLGEAWIVSSLRCVDAQPALLASRLAIWLEPEMETLRAASPDERARRWTERVAALEDERRLRAADPRRTVYGAAQ